MASNPSEIPKFVVDLSKPTEHRYDHITPEFLQSVKECNIPGLLDELLSAFAGSFVGKILKTVTWLSLRRLHDPDQSSELKGISRASGIPMYILVAFNVLLDLLLGCTSGGVRVHEPGTSGKGCSTRSQAKYDRMVHFRTLDWGMDRLRNIVVELDFVRRPGGPVVATTITYFGYIGVLTGVRKGLSMSLNFRPRHAQDTFRQKASFRWHQTMVLLGRRQSVSSVLRGFLLDPLPEAELGDKQEESDVPELSEQHMAKILETLSQSESTAAYLIFCQPQRVYVVEKDHRSAKVFQSETYLAAFNHDKSDEENPEQLKETAENYDSEDPIGMAEIVAFSVERKDHLDDRWKQSVKACKRKHRTNSGAVSMSGVYDMVQDEEVSNVETHYAVIMDPSSGEVIWRTVYELGESDDEDDEEEGAGDGDWIDDEDGGSTTRNADSVGLRNLGSNS